MVLKRKTTKKCVRGEKKSGECKKKPGPKKKVTKSKKGWGRPYGY